MAELARSFHARTLSKAYPADHEYKLALYETMPEQDTYTASGECRDAGYPAGGIVLTGHRVVEMDGGAALVFDTHYDLFDVTLKTVGAAVYDATEGDYISFIPFGRPTGVIGGIFSVTLNKDGVAWIGQMDSETLE